MCDDDNMSAVHVDDVLKLSGGGMVPTHIPKGLSQNFTRFHYLIGSKELIGYFKIVSLIFSKA